MRPNVPFAKIVPMLPAGFIVGYVLGGRSTFDSLVSSTALYGDLASVVDVLVVTAVAAAVTAGVLARVNGRSALVVLLAALLVIVFQSLGMATGLLGAWASALGAGALLGASAILAGSVRAAQAALAIGLIAGGRLGSELDRLLQYTEGRQFAWDAFAADDAVVVERAIILVCASVLVAVLSVVAYRGSPPEPQLGGNAVFVGVALPVAAGICSWSTGGFRISSTVWFLALAALGALALLAAYLLPGRDGRLVLVLFATGAATAGGVGYVGDSYLWIGLTAALLLAGALLGYLVPQVYLGLVGLFLIAAAGLASEYVGDVPVTVAVWAVPLVAAYVLVSVLPTPPVSLAVSLPVMFTMTLPVTVYAGTYAPLTSAGDGMIGTQTALSSMPSEFELSIAGIVVVLCASGACAYLSRARPAARARPA